MPDSANILLVEDDADQAALFALVLRMAGYQVTNAGDAETAYELLTERHFDLVLTDWQLPGMWGDVLISKIHARFLSTPTILMSNDPQARLTAHTVKATAWHSKQDGIMRLRSVVANALQGNTSNVQRRLQPAV